MLQIIENLQNFIMEKEYRYWVASEHSNTENFKTKFNIMMLKYQ